MRREGGAALLPCEHHTRTPLDLLTIDYGEHSPGPYLQLLLRIGRDGRLAIQLSHGCLGALPRLKYGGCAAGARLAVPQHADLLQSGELQGLKANVVQEMAVHQGCAGCSGGQVLARWRQHTGMARRRAGRPVE